jgi:hypothetical protein
MLQLWFFSNTMLWPVNASLGGFALGLNVVVLMLAGAIWLIRRPKVSISSVKTTSLVFIYMSFSLLIAANGPCNDSILKLGLTAPILLFLIFIGVVIGQKSTNRDWLKLEKTATWALLVAFAAFAVEMLMPQKFPSRAMYRSAGEYSGIFSEPSHVAFSLFPCIAVLLVAESKQTRRKGTIALLGLIVFSRSSTLLGLIAAWILYQLATRKKIRQFILLASLIVSLVILASVMNYEAIIAPTATRITGVVASDTTSNVSSLVYVQGWEDAWANLLHTHGLGLGFNMMGCPPLPDVAARRVLALVGLDLNAQDGSFLFAKIVSESGIFGIAFYITIVWLWIRLEKRTASCRDREKRLIAAVQAAIIFCFIASSFLRGAGFFSGGLLLWVVAISGALKSERNLLPEITDGKQKILKRFFTRQLSNMK